MFGIDDILAFTIGATAMYIIREKNSAENNNDTPSDE